MATSRLESHSAWWVDAPDAHLDRPTYLVDGRCGFCVTWMRRVQRLFPGTFDAVSLYDFDLASVDLDLEQCTRVGHFLKPVDGRILIRSGSQSWAGILLEQGPAVSWVGRLMGRPPVRAVADLVYSSVARNRQRLPGGTPVCSANETPSRAHHQG